MTEWALVTGSAKRLGRELACTLAKMGYNVACHYNTSKKEAEETCALCRAFGVEALAIQGDFSTERGSLQFIEDYKRLVPSTKVLINNVGNYIIKSASKTTPEESQALFQTNVEMPLLLTQALLNSLESVINIGTAGLNGFRADVKSPIYMSTKIALYSLTKSLAKELASQGVRVNMVSPGYLDYSVDLPDPKTLPMKRACTSSEIARVVAFLLAKESSYITGQNIEVAGGVHL